MSESFKYCIIGAGPTGLGAAWRLAELGERDFLLLERNPHVGGLSASFKDKAGFTWDLGGHVVFSHYDYFDRLLDSLLGEDRFEHIRVAAVRMAERWIPYPFQNNIRRLPKRLLWECLEGLLDAGRQGAQPADFGQWIDAVFGAGIAKLFMRPYNFKVWAHPPEAMAWRWIGERVSLVDAKSTIRRVVLEEDDTGFGPNARFKFPKFGGTGAIYERMAEKLRDHIRLSSEVVEVDAAHKTLRLADGDEIGYEKLLNTSPLDRFVDALVQRTEAMVDGAKRLHHNGVYVAGVGVDGFFEDPKCWMYFPEDNAPFYRLTNFHNYSPNNCAKPFAQRALMAETSFSGHKPEAIPTLAQKTLDGLVNVGMLDAAGRTAPVSLWEATLDYGYPIPSLERDAGLAAIQPALEALGISSRGRFGGWRYEVANMDHSVMQGVEWAERMLLGKPETTYGIPT